MMMFGTVPIKPYEIEIVEENEKQHMNEQKQHSPPRFVKWTESVVSKLNQNKKDNDDEKKKKKDVIISNLIGGWGSMVEATQRAAEATKEAVEKERERILHDTAGLFNGNQNTMIRRRDPKLPLDADALRDTEVVYITDRIITMGHPAIQSSTHRNLTAERKLAAVGHLLHHRHSGRFMVWNLSEAEYDYSLLDDQVLTFKFPGSPSPPLGLLMKLLMSIESWLRADERNIAVLHCLTGRGRSSTVLAAFLCWTGEAGFHDPNTAIEYIAQCKCLDVDNLTIPSQRRYMTYFANMLDAVRPSQPPLLLTRIVMSEAPKFGIQPKSTNTGKEGRTNEEPLGCVPYIQIFKAGNLVFETSHLASYVPSDGPISIPVGTIVQGDILIRCRHLTETAGHYISMFRAAFHTGYIPPKVLRLTKAQLDCACIDERFKDDFFLDLIFEPCNAEMASRYMGDNHLATMNGDDNKSVTATACDTMIHHRDSRFWDVITTRRSEITKKNDEKKNSDEKDQKHVLLYGPTIGRRRDLVASNINSNHVNASSGSAGVSLSSSQDIAKRNAAASVCAELDAFTIGVDFDLSVEDKETMSAGSTKLHPPKKDELMEALLALDDETASLSSQRLANFDQNRLTETEEIVFGVDKNEEKDETEKTTTPILRTKNEEKSRGGISTEVQFEIGDGDLPTQSDQTLKSMPEELSKNTEIADASKQNEEAKSDVVTPSSNGRTEHILSSGTLNNNNNNNGTGVFVLEDDNQVDNGAFGVDEELEDLKNFSIG